MKRRKNIADLTPNLSLMLTTAHFDAILKFLQTADRGTPKAAYEANLQPFVDSGLNCPAVITWCFHLMADRGLIGDAKVRYPTRNLKGA